MNTIDQVQINFNPDQLFILNICLAFLMFGVALDLRLDNFKEILRKPKGPTIGLISQWLLLPLMTICLVYFFNPPTSIALGMVLVAACPGGNVSNYAVHLSGANAALSVLLTSISTLAAIVITPIYFTWLSQLVPGAEVYAASIYVDPANMVNTIFQLILLPLFLGMFINTRFPKFANKMRGTVKALSMTIFLAFVVMAVFSNFSNIQKYLHLVFLLVLVHNGLALSMGFWFARANGLSIFDARAISIETGIQNSGLGLILIFNFFGGLGGMAMVAAWWGIWHLISAFSLAMWWKQRSSPVLSS
ncbi:MAG: symporter [Saprospiraceae bacterium]|nr:MAG: symporter [Saprospiraceae bacterium]